MENVHPFPLSRRNARRGVALAATVTTAVVALGVGSLAWFGELPAAAMSEASAKSHAPARADPAAAKSMTDAGRDDTATRGFDYFPGNYRNQATEPAEPIATF